MITIRCTCGETYRADEQHAGRRIRCGKCGKVLDIVGDVHDHANLREQSDSPSVKHSYAPARSYVRRPSRLRTILWIAAASFAGILFGSWGVYRIVNPPEAKTSTASSRPPPAPLPAHGAVWVSDEPKPPPSGPKTYFAAPAPAPAPARVRPAYVRAAVADNGQPWPTSSAYIRGYPRLHNDGLSTVTIDNTQNDSDVHVKLESLNGPPAYHPVRTFFISGHGSFTLNRVTAGNYDIRYRDLSTGGLSRSEAFDLVESPTYNGTQFSNFTMTLYKVRNGNMQTYDLAEDEF